MRLTMGWLVGLLVVFLSGCGAPSVSADGEQSLPADGDSADPIALVGLWTVEAAGEEDGAVLRLDVPLLDLFRGCGAISGSWSADHDGLFVAATDGWSSECGDDPRPSWLNEAALHRPDGDGHLLLDDTGDVVARLVPSDVPALPPNVAQSSAHPPVVTDDVPEALRPSAPLPHGVEAADPAALLGRWLPSDAPAGSEAYALFGDDGQWRGSDGCNGLGGRWRSGPDGAFLAVAGASTTIGCENIPVDLRLVGAARAGLDDGALVLFDRRGEPAGRFNRADRPADADDQFPPCPPPSSDPGPPPQHPDPEEGPRCDARHFRTVSPDPIGKQPSPPP